MTIQSLAAHQLHCVKHAAVFERAHVVNGDDAGVFDARQHSCFAPHPLFVRNGRHLHCDLAVQFKVVRPKHDAHGTAAQFFSDLVTATGHVFHMPEHAVREPVHLYAYSQQCPGLAAELVFSDSDLAELLQHDAANCA